MRLLRRAGGPAQTGRSRAERLAGPSFTVCGTIVGGTSVVLVDDVITTGATASAAARALHQAGTGRVAVLAAARTPPFRLRSAG